MTISTRGLSRSTEMEAGIGMKHSSSSIASHSLSASAIPSLAAFNIAEQLSLSLFLLVGKKKFGLTTTVDQSLPIPTSIMAWRVSTAASVLWDALCLDLTAQWLRELGDKLRCGRVITIVKVSLGGNFSDICRFFPES